MEDQVTYLTTHYSPALVVMSWMVAIFAAYSATSTLQHIRENNRSPLWLMGGASAFGIGVWAMHFIGMSALDIGTIMVFDIPLTAASVLFSIAGAAAAFWFVGTNKVGMRQILPGGVFLGAGIGGMHYLGMYAMRVDATLSLDLVWLGASVAVAVTISSLGLWLLSTPILLGLPFRNLMLSAVVGAAIPIMHYTGMMAVRFSASQGHHTTGHSDLSTAAFLVINVAVMIAVVLMTIPLFASNITLTRSNSPQEADI